MEMMISEYKVPSFLNKNIESVKTSLKASGINYKIIGSGTKVIKQYPEKNDKITNKDTVYLITNDSKLKIPNVVGLSSKVANNLLKQLGVKVKLEGVGYVTSQSISENTEITPGLEITLKLSPKFTG